MTDSGVCGPIDRSNYGKAGTQHLIFAIRRFAGPWPEFAVAIWARPRFPFTNN